MKKTWLILVTLISAWTANAGEPFVSISNVDPLALINWKVGDSADYQITAIFGKVGTMHKEVTKDEPNGLWITQSTSLAGQEEKVEAMIDKDTGKVLKIVRNGKEETTTNDEPEIISQDYEDVTVPAGTFKSMHIVAKTKQIKKIEAWINNRDIVMDGTIKQNIPAFFGSITMELTQQKRMQ